MKKIVSLFILAILLFSCNNNNVPSIGYHEDKELIPLSNFLGHEKEYDFFGSYDLKGKPLSTHFYIGSKLKLEVVRLGSVSEKTTYKITQKAPDYYGLSIGIGGELFYSAGAPDTSALKSVTIYADEYIQDHKVNDSIKEYDIRYKKCIIQINAQQDSGIKTESIRVREAELALYEKHKQLYLFVLTTIDETVPLEKGSLLKYLQTDWQPDLNVSFLPKDYLNLKKKMGKEQRKIVDSIDNTMLHRGGKKNIPAASK